jgi:hypothetical protein
MATHDYVIDNSTGANVRADINLVLQAILTNNSSSSAPSTTAAYMWWADTTNGVLKIRNSSNNDWVELLQLDGTLTLEDGSASTPGLAFRDDLNTGIFSSAADTFNVATGGVERMELGATTIFNEDGADVDFRIEGDTEANLFYVDAGNDRIGIGTSSPAVNLHVNGSTPTLRVSNGTSQIVELKADASASILRTTTNHPLLFGTNDNERMRIDSSGRLLLGTTTEGHANGDDLTIATSGNTGLTIRSGTSSAGNIYFSDGTSGDDEYRGFISYDHSNNLFNFATNSASKMTIDSSGRLLLGTTTEGETSADNFTIADTSSDCGISIRSGTSNAGNIFFSDGTSGNDEFRGYVQYNHASNYMRFATDSAERVRIDSSGNVGIGTTSPGHRLHLKGTDTAYGTSVAVGSILELEDAAGRKSQFIAPGAVGEAGAGTPTNHDFTLFTNNNERIRIKNDGNVGIGTASPSGKLNLATGAATACELRLTSNNTGSGSGERGRISVHSSRNDGTAYEAGRIEIDRSNGTEDKAHIMFYTNNGSGTSERMRILSDGIVDIYSAYTNPVGGTTRDLYVRSDGRLGYLSSIRASKTNIVDLTNISWLNNLKPKAFNIRKKNDSGEYTDNYYDELEYGLIAEDVESVNKELCSYSSDNALEAVQYRKLVVPLLKAVQELTAKVAALEAA